MHALYGQVQEERTYPTRLGELAPLVVKVLCDADVAHHCPWLPRAQQRGREDDGVEGHIILAHELHQLHILYIAGSELMRKHSAFQG